MTISEYRAQMDAFALAVSEERLDDALVAYRAARAALVGTGKNGPRSFLSALAEAAGAKAGASAPLNSSLD